MLSEYRGAGSKARGVRNGLQGVIHCKEKNPEEREEKAGGGREKRRVGGGGGSGDESCGTIFHSRQKHLLGYQFGAAEQSSPPAPSSIIFPY